MSRTSKPYGAGRVVRPLFTSVALLVLAVPSLAARVTDVRVGQHPTYTRVVFELDQMRGYRLTRQGTGGVLVVDLDANGTAESLAASGMVERVVLEEAAEGAVARIHIKGDMADLRVQEMILGKPPRIVLDIMKPESVAATPAPTPVSVVEPEPVVAVAPTSTPKSTPTPQAAPPPRPEKPRTIAGASEQKRVVPRPAPPQTVAKPPSEPAVAVEPTPSTDPATLAVAPAASKPVEIAKPAPKPAPKPKALAKPAPQPVSESARSGGVLENPVLLGGGALLLLLGVAGFMELRRRTAAAERSPEEAAMLDAPLEDAVADADTGEHTPVAEEGFSLDEIAFETASEDQAPDADDVPGADLDAEGAVPIAEARPDNVVSIFDADEGETLASEGDDPMSDLMSDLPTDAEAGMIVTPPPAMGAEEMGGEVARMMEAMERRMSQLEARLDEATEAREKLERQVAAQAEELRVQRAAIARTQRALRGMNRSAAPETPSEPALRDGTQARTQVTG